MYVVSSLGLIALELAFAAFPLVQNVVRKNNICSFLSMSHRGWQQRGEAQNRLDLHHNSDCPMSLYIAVGISKNVGGAESTSAVSAIASQVCIFLVSRSLGSTPGIYLRSICLLTRSTHFPHTRQPKLTILLIQTEAFSKKIACFYKPLHLEV